MGGLLIILISLGIILRTLYIRYDPIFTTLLINNKPRVVVFYTRYSKCDKIKCKIRTYKILL